MYNQKIKEVENIYQKRLQNVLSSPTIKKGIITNNIRLMEKDFIDRFQKIQKENKYVETMLIVDKDNIAKLRAHKPSFYNDDLSGVRPIIKRSNIEKKIFFGFEAGKVSMPYRITVPIIYDNIHYGVIDMGISSDYFIQHLNTISTQVEVMSLLSEKFSTHFIDNNYLNNFSNKKGYFIPTFNEAFEPFFDKIDLTKDISQVKQEGKTYLINTTFKINSFDKKPFGIILVSYDITEDIYKQKINIIKVIILSLLIILLIYFILRYYEKELLNQVKSYEALFLNSSDSVLLIKDNEIIDCNKAVIEMFDYLKIDIVGMSPSELSPLIQPDGKSSKEKAKKLIGWTLLNGPQRFEWKHLRSNKEEFWCEVSLTPMTVNNETIIHASLRDITAIKEIEELSQNIIEEKTNEYKTAMLTAQKANSAKSEFLANMSHEIRTPLNAIMGFITLLKEDEVDKDKIGYLKTIDISSQNLLEIINNILDFSKIESNLIECELIDFNPTEEFNTIANLFRARMREKQIDFQVEIDKNLPDVINSDPLRLKQVITNLLSNAVKFTSSNKRIIFKVVFENKKLTVSIQDEGIGIPKNKLSSIFEPFTQADNSTTREFGGSGLGLSISSELIEKFKGKLEVKSELNKGSEFFFTIPIKVSNKSLVTEESFKKTSDEVPLSGHILIVEDNKANQMFMKVILKKMNLTFDIANDGQEAVDIFKKIKYDLLLMDENMPYMSGIEATKLILEYEKTHHLIHTPIIALTANALKGDRERFLKAGMDHYLTKPLNKNELYQIFSSFLGLKENRR